MLLGRLVTTRRAQLADAALALALALPTLPAGMALFTGRYNPKLERTYGSSQAWERAVLVWWVLCAVCLAGLLVQHRWPVAALLLAAAGAGGHLLNPRFSLVPLDLAVPVALYTLTTLTRIRWLPWVAAATMSVGGYLLGVAGQVMVDLQVANADPGARPLTIRDDLPVVLADSIGRAGVEVVLVLVLAFVLGTATRTRRAYLAALEQRAADLEREQNQRAALAIAAERARITRELHDVVAHGLSVMVVQAQGAAAAQDRHPERTAAALQHIIATGRASLAEMRRLLGIARSRPTGEPALAPLPGVGALPALVDQIRAAGTPVRLDVEGEPVPLPAGVDLSAYRIVQEALTNTLKHAGPGARASVRLGFAADRLEVEVSDDGSGAGPDQSTVDTGNGLRGIAERVDTLGGELAVGPGTGGGFRVRALLPIQPEAAGPERVEPRPVGAST